MTQINTPYPATAYLTGFLRERGFDARQADPGLELLLRLLSRRGVEDMAKHVRGDSPAIAHFRENVERYATTIDAVIRFLQG